MQQGKTAALGSEQSAENIHLCGIQALPYSVDLGLFSIIHTSIVHQSWLSGPWKWICQVIIRWWFGNLKLDWPRR